MTGPEHFSEAERLLAQARQEDGEGVYYTRLNPENLAAAQVHATLALAAATAQAGIDDMDLEEFQAWAKVCGAPS